MSRPYEHGGNILSLARQRGLSPTELIDFSASINPLGLSPVVRHAIVNALDSLVHYPDNDCGELKLALAEFHGLKQEHFAIANGSTEIIYTLPGLLPGKSALIVSPTFSEYTNALRLHQREIRHLPLSPADGFALNLDRLASLLENYYDALYLCNPGNPSGALYPRRVVEQVYDLCRDTGTFLVLDEAFMDFSEEESAKTVIIAADQGIVLRSMTKFYGIPGLRLGYAMAAPSLIERLSSLGGPWSVNTLAQVAGVAALRDSDYIRRSLADIADLRRKLSGAISTIPGLKVYPSSANFLLIELTSDISSTELKELLLDRMILIRDCGTFTGLTNRFIRVAVRTEAENIRLVEGLGSILA